MTRGSFSQVHFEAQARARRDLGIDADDPVQGAALVPHGEVVAPPDAEVDVGGRLDPAPHAGPPALEARRLRPRGEDLVW